MRERDFQIMNLLLCQEGIDIHSICESGNSALDTAVRMADSEIVKLLLDHGSTKAATQEKRDHTLVEAAGLSLPIFELFIGRVGFDISNARTWKGQSVLHFAAKNGILDTVQLLLDQYRIDINAQDDYGNTALSIAVDNGDEDIVRLLVNQKGININLPNAWKLTPLAQARWRESCRTRYQRWYSPIIAKLLSDHGGIEPDIRRPRAQSQQQLNKHRSGQESNAKDKPQQEITDGGNEGEEGAEE